MNISLRVYSQLFIINKSTVNLVWQWNFLFEDDYCNTVVGVTPLSLYPILYIKKMTHIELSWTLNINKEPSKIYNTVFGVNETVVGL